MSPGFPKSHKIFHDFVKKTKDIETAVNAVQYGDRVVFVISKKNIVYDHEMFIHVILDPSKKSKDTNIILKDQLYKSLSTQQQTLNDKMKTAVFSFYYHGRKLIEHKFYLVIMRAKQLNRSLDLQSQITIFYHCVRMMKNQSEDI